MMLIPVSLKSEGSTIILCKGNGILYSLAYL